MCNQCGCRTMADLECDSCRRRNDNVVDPPYWVGIEYKGWVILIESDDSRVPYQARKENSWEGVLNGDSVEDLMEQIDDLS